MVGCRTETFQCAKQLLLLSHAHISSSVISRVGLLLEIQSEMTCMVCKSNVQYMQFRNMQKHRYGPLNTFFFLPVSALHYRFACGIYYSICTEWSCIINMNVHNHRYMKNNNASTHFAPQRAVCLWLSLHQEWRIWILTQIETDLLQAKQGTF